MTPDIQKRWVAELRSGKVEQAHGEMVGEPAVGPNGTFPCRCALAVLLVDVIHIPAHIVEGGNLTPLREHLNGGQRDIVVGWNDVELMGFDEIADRIERGEMGP